MYSTMKDLRGEHRLIIEQVQHKTEKDYAVDIKAIATSCSVKIKYVDFPHESQSGELCRLVNGTYIIRISQDLKQDAYRNRKRYTIAHEIAHYMLHGHLLKPGQSLERGLKDGWEDSRETEANRLAADILMPNFLLRKIIHEMTEKRTVENVAKALCVSAQALRIKLNMPDNP